MGLGLGGTVAQEHAHSELVRRGLVKLEHEEAGIGHVAFIKGVCDLHRRHNVIVMLQGNMLQSDRSKYDTDQCVN